MYKNFILLISIIPAVISCQNAEFNIRISDFIEFDKAFIPFNYYCSKGDDNNAEQYSVRFANVWKDLKKKHSSSQSNKFFKEMDNYIQKSISDIKNGKSDECIETLTEIKYHLYQYREDKKISYFPDNLIILQESIDNMMLTFDGNKNSELDEFDITRISSELEEAEIVFSKMESFDFDSNIYEFNALKTMSFTKEIIKERTLLAGLKKSIAGRNTSKIKKNVISVYDGYYDIYKLFGDFSI